MVTVDDAWTKMDPSFQREKHCQGGSTVITEHSVPPKKSDKSSFNS